MCTLGLSMWVSHDSIGRVCPLKLLHRFASPHAMVKVTTALGACSSDAHLRMQFCTHRKKCCWTYMHANKLAFICISPVITCQSPPSLICISSVLVTHMTMCLRSWCYWSGSASPHWAQNMSYVACLMFGIASQHRLLALLAPTTTKGRSCIEQSK